MRTSFLVPAAALLAAVALLAGCEGGGNGNPWDNYDFGANNPAIGVAFGDSITEGSGAAPGDAYPPTLSALSAKTVYNEGIAGSTTAEGLDRISGVLREYKPGFLFILFGANDVIMDYGEQQAADNLRNMIRVAKANKTVPVVGTLTPMTASHAAFNSSVNRLNITIRRIAAEEDVPLADLNDAFVGYASLLLPDGLHPNPSGYDVIAATFNNAIQ